VSTTYCDAGFANIFNPFAFNCPQQIPGSSAVRNLTVLDGEGNITTLHVSKQPNGTGRIS
jgi:hypothetical protein